MTSGAAAPLFRRMVAIVPYMAMLMMNAEQNRTDSRINEQGRDKNAEFAYHASHNDGM